MSWRLGIDRLPADRTSVLARHRQAIRSTLEVAIGMITSGTIKIIAKDTPISSRRKCAPCMAEAMNTVPNNSTSRAATGSNRPWNSDSMLVDVCRRRELSAGRERKERTRAIAMMTATMMIVMITIPISGRKSRGRGRRRRRRGRGSRIRGCRVGGVRSNRDDGRSRGPRVGRLDGNLVVVDQGLAACLVVQAVVDQDSVG